ncbi:MAG TPA: CehA/McbA family metallohydrolase [Kofleriaceae bacterium]|nr:CehA/McbA family metallohydrolase [Kofleriaceae bacterium]
MIRALAIAVACAACAGADVSPPASPASPLAPDAALSSPLEPGADLHEAHDPHTLSAGDDPQAAPSNVADLPPAPAVIAPADIPGASTTSGAAGDPGAPGEPEVWLKGVTHVHAKASGDSSEPPASVIAWYEQHHYDFIALTDHNRVSELDPKSNTRGQITLRDPQHGLIVLSGIELTHNPIGCLPVGDPSRNCRIHVNLLGPTARPGKRLEWAERRSHARLDMYRAAAAAQASLGGIAQINHPQWLWGMTPDLLVELSRRGMRLMEIANAAFTRWNAGDATHLSTEALWDAALMQGATVWGTASDDAHHYQGHGQWPPGGGWVVVHARREPQAILDALAGGRFYASNGVVLEHAEVDGEDLRVEIDPAAPGRYTIEFIENGRRADSIAGKVARRPLPAEGYVRAVVTRDDGKRAWVQPARR